jgi:hypothetical protein
MSSNKEWSSAFARQAKADLETRKVLLTSPGVPRSQLLHFLQMACEKLAKAHIYHTGNVPDDIQRSHAHIAKYLPEILKDVYIHRHRKTPSGALFKEFRRLAREIELLAPTVQAGGNRPDNCEYPWEDVRGRLHIPAEHGFPELKLETPIGAEMLKLLPIAIAEVLS